jgi:hypothetical protein
MPLDVYDENSREQQPASAARPYIGVFFECCGLYSRIYRHPDSAEYAGRCPRCLATVRAQVGPDGTTQRIFRAT